MDESLLVCLPFRCVQVCTVLLGRDEMKGSLVESIRFPPIQLEGEGGFQNMASETPSERTRQDAAPAVAETTTVPHSRWVVVDEANHNLNLRIGKAFRDRDDGFQAGRSWAGGCSVRHKQFTCLSASPTMRCRSTKEGPCCYRLLAPCHENSTLEGLDAKFPASW